ncbi:MAG: cobalt-precorrin-5B (C(1))-methyltransferase CbiD [Betaproteobacteria bacterium]|nr:cobalt-precorrin-5B (C(1))-methyltransferase CbiD [Betaproteobacteria bacterium]
MVIAMTRKKETKTLRWGYSTGACAAAVATAAWQRLTRGETPPSIRLRFLDGKDRFLPLAEPGVGRMAAIRKDAGDDPDCTDGATLYANIRPSRPSEAKPEDYTLTVGGGVVILRAVEGVGLCTRLGLDCERDRWAINTGPRRMIADNLFRAGLDAGCWLLEIGVRDGQEIAKRTLNHLLGIQGGISVLGTTGLVRPYSHEAYRDTIRICLKSHHLSGGSTIVFCTGGRTKSGAQAHLPGLPETAFVSIGDFIAESLSLAYRYDMREVIVACMAGKLCKYAAGFENTHAGKVSQDMDMLRSEVRRLLPAETALHTALERSVSVREALLFLPKAARPELLRRLARAALGHFVRRCPGRPVIRLLVFDFTGSLLFEELEEASAGETCRGEIPMATPDDDEASLVLADASDIVGPLYFMRGKHS